MVWNARSDPTAAQNRERDIRRLQKWRRMLGAHQEQRIGVPLPVALARMLQ